MAEPAPINIVRRFMKDMERLDYDSALTLVSEDCDYLNPPPLPPVKGPAGIRAVLEPFFAPTLSNEFRILRAAADGPVVFMERLDIHHLTGRTVELPVTGVFQVKDGKIVYWRDYFDAPSILSKWPSAD